MEDNGKPLKLFALMATSRKRLIDGTVQSWDQLGVQMATSGAEAFFVFSNRANKEWFPAEEGYYNTIVRVMEVSPKYIEVVYLSQKGILQ